MTMPMTPVINPPVRKDIQRGKALAKSLAGETTLAAMLTASVATTAVNIEIATTGTLSNWLTTFNGSHKSFAAICGYMTMAADVIITPIAANIVIVVGSATTCPTACSRWLRPKRVKSGMFKESVAQNPIIAVSDGMKTGQNSARV